jgi:O-antigen/teichoic acid export membrane protein
VLVLFADPIIALVFGSAFLPMRDYLMIFLAFCIPFTLSRTFGFYWLFLNKSDRINTYITMTFLAVYLAALVVLSSLFSPVVPLLFMVVAWTALLIFYVVYIYVKGLNKPAPPILLIGQ